MTLDKAAWGPGRWTDEPDRLEFRHLGLPCLLNRNSMGAWCGYAAVPPGHPLHGAGTDSDLVDLAVHGGVTYAAACSEEICHVPDPGEPDDVWWIGFDCAHSSDLIPALKDIPGLRGQYRDVAYARRVTEALAEQLAALRREGPP